MPQKLYDNQFLKISKSFVNQKFDSFWLFFTKFEEFVGFLDDYINYLALYLKEQFQKNEEFLKDVYFNSNYHLVWKLWIQKFVFDSIYFEPMFYFYVSLVLDKKRENFAKFLQEYLKTRNDKDKEKNWKSLAEFIEKNWENVKISENEFKNIEIDKKYLNKKKIKGYANFLAHIFIKLQWDTKLRFLQIFDFEYQRNRLSASQQDFEKIYIVVKYIFDFFRYKPNWFNEIVKKEVFEKEQQAIQHLNKIIDNYNKDLEWFPKVFQFIEKTYNNQSFYRHLLYWYVKTQIIEKYYPEIKKIFYFYDDKISSKDFHILNASLSYENIQQNEILIQIYRLKQIILNLYNSFTWFLLRPFLIFKLTKFVKNRDKDLKKLRFVLCFLFAESFNEFKKIRDFFDSLILLRKEDTNLYKKTFFRIFFFHFLILFCFLIFVFFYGPFILFLWIILFLIKLVLDYFTELKWYFYFPLNLLIFLMIWIGFYGLINKVNLMFKDIDFPSAITRLSTANISDITSYMAEILKEKWKIWK